MPFDSERPPFRGGRGGGRGAPRGGGGFRGGRGGGGDRGRGGFGGGDRGRGGFRGGRGGGGFGGGGSNYGRDNYGGGSSFGGGYNNNNNDSGGFGGGGNAFIDWDDISNFIQDESKFLQKAEVVKNFYEEHPETAEMGKADVMGWRESNFNITLTSLSKDAEQKKKQIRIRPCVKFEHAFHNEPDILKTVANQGFEKPTPIQAQIWPAILQGIDTVGIAQTGTGKTLAFLLPMFVHIMKQTTPLKERKGPSALILSPTRELALQIEAEIGKYKYKGLRVAAIYGGGDKHKQLRAIDAGVEIVVATPGRMNDLINQGRVSVEDVTYAVLDEADRMLDMGFEPQILKIFLDIRKTRQTVMTSATWPAGVRNLVSTYMNDPLQVVVGSLDLTGVETVTQVIKIVQTDGNLDYRGKISYMNNKLKELKRVCKAFDKGNDKMIIFCATKRGADDLTRKINSKMAEPGKPIADAMHGDRSQNEREYTLKRFRSGGLRMLVATDVAARGLDVDDVNIVVNFDFPTNVEEYVHRIGRTGRAGRTGTAVSLFTKENSSSAKELIEILKKNEKCEIPTELHEFARNFSNRGYRANNTMRFRSGALNEQRSSRRGGGGGGYGRY